MKGRAGTFPCPVGFVGGAAGLVLTAWFFHELFAVFVSSGFDGGFAKSVGLCVPLVSFWAGVRRSGHRRRGRCSAYYDVECLHLHGARLVTMRATFQF